MKVQIVSLGEEAQETHEGDIYNITINGKEVFSVSDDNMCPEDNNLCRSFNDIYSIGEIIEKAFDAGKRGEDLTIDRQKLTQKEYDER